MQGVPLSIQGIDHILSGVILSIQTSTYGIPTLGEQPSSMVHLHMDLLPIKLIITLVFLGIMIFLDQKRFKSLRGLFSCIVLRSVVQLLRTP